MQKNKKKMALQKVAKLVNSKKKPEINRKQKVKIKLMKSLKKISNKMTKKNNRSINNLHS